jgi:hypothetical protein
MIRYVTEIRYPLDRFDFGELDGAIEKAMNCFSDGAGAGFGERDMSFTFQCDEDRKRALIRLRRNVEGVSVNKFEYED